MPGVKKYATARETELRAPPRFATGHYGRHAPESLSSAAGYRPGALRYIGIPNAVSVASRPEPEAITTNCRPLLVR